MTSSVLINNCLFIFCRDPNPSLLNPHGIMTDIVIKAENLGKKYTIGHQAKKGGYTSLRDVLMQNARTLWNKSKDLATGRPIIQGDTMEEVWALKDVSFEIRRGEAIGIIGRNGAGKSTLLKILSRITEPSTGRIAITGRVACLLEVGTGFHSELTGRENIYLNGTILGMTRVEIKRKFDEIVAFAEVEKYLDTPVKRYSSGMYVRLAFSVAAHLEPEILVVDEVLAVGDARFQKKCFGKMEEIGKEDRTVLFVSHNMTVINHLCSHGVLLDKGKIIASGTASNTIRKYEQMAMQSFSSEVLRPGTIYSKDLDDYTMFDVLEIGISDREGRPLSQVETFEDFTFKISFYSPKFQPNGSVAIFIQLLNGATVLRIATRPDSCFDMDFKEGENTVLCHIKKLPLPAGTYVLGIALAIPMREWLYLDREVCTIDVQTKDIQGSGFPPLQEHALAVVQYYWKV